ncbi:MAG: tetratricopeptide repeat protein, partial [Dissulfurimicrobium sp.]
MLYPLHADFLSRLAMTFSHGDYARIAEVKEKERTAESLFERALGYYPDQRVFLGLAIIRQKRGDMEGSAKIASEGLKHFPYFEDLNICMGINCMNLGRYEEALSYFLPF